MNEASYLLSLNVLVAVLAVMTVLVAVVSLLAKLGDLIPVEQAVKKNAVGTPNAELIAVLTAAATEALGSPVCLHRIHLRQPAHPHWATAGRMDIMSSHRVEPRR